MKSIVLKDAQFLTDAEGKRTGVLLDLKTYQELCEAREELADIEAYDRSIETVRREVQSGETTKLDAYRMKRQRKAK